MRQVPWTGTLLSESPVQSICAIGRPGGDGLCSEMGRAKLRADGSSWVHAKLEGSCPTVDEELGLELIKEIETYHLEKRARLAVLTG